MTRESTSLRWASAWPDALGFALGLSVAWIAGWTATDLVWSLWLSSLVVGYATIVWTIMWPGVLIARTAGREPARVARAFSENPGSFFVGVSILLVGALFLLGFFTIHFGGFHYIHSQFLIGFFPIDGAPAARPGTADMSTYLEVAKRYWHFLPAAFLAERAAFLRQPPVKDDLAVTAAAIAARKARNARNSGGGLFVAPYKNVLRMHLLIFFFAFAHFAKLDGFAVYAVIYAAYFFPWRLLRRPSPGSAGATADA